MTFLSSTPEHGPTREGIVAARARISDAIAKARAQSDSLFESVRPEALFERPIPERHRIIFYIGHLEAFDWNQIGDIALHIPPVSSELDRLFAFGIDPPLGQLPSDAPGDWPAAQQTWDYAAQARAAVDGVIRSAPLPLLHVILEHRLMHMETLRYMLHNLPYAQRITGQSSGPEGVSETDRPTLPAPHMIEIPAGEAILGCDRPSDDAHDDSHECFGWDNEFEKHRIRVPAFAVSKYKVTNGEYLKFVEQGGPVPHYWCFRDGQWFYRGWSSEYPLPPNSPVYVSHSNAIAYARWAGKSLLSEAEFHRAAYGVPAAAQNGNRNRSETDAASESRADEESHAARPYPWGQTIPTEKLGNFHFFHDDPLPVTAHPLGESAFGVAQLVGNGWEWTRTEFAPFPGFRAFPFYTGYSANFFDGDHYVLKGGSPVTDARLLRPSFRNWFRRDYPYAYATFRLIET